MPRALTWLKNAAVRTLHTALPATARPDDAWARSRLPEVEYRLFAQLPPAERAHAIAVARCVERRWGQRGDPREGEPSAEPPVALIRASLLHDVGKLGRDNHVAWRVLSHVLGPSDAPSEPRLDSLAGVRQTARHHPAYGAALVLAAGGDPEVARLVGLHHRRGEDALADALRECDEIT